MRNGYFLVGCVIAAVSGYGLADIKNTHAPPIEDRATEMGKTGSRGGIGRRADDCNCRGLVAEIFAARSAPRGDRGGEHAGLCAYRRQGGSDSAETRDK